MNRSPSHVCVPRHGQWCACKYTHLNQHTNISTVQQQESDINNYYFPFFGGGELYIHLPSSITVYPHRLSGKSLCGFICFWFFLLLSGTDRFRSLPYVERTRIRYLPVAGFLLQICANFSNILEKCHSIE